MPTRLSDADTLAAISMYCAREREWLIGLIERLARLESPSHDKSAVDRVGDSLGAELTALGWRVEHVQNADAGNHVRGEWGSGDAQILLLGHLDTVWPVGQLETMPVRRAGGRLYGPGVYDMKAGAALGVLAVRALDSTARAPRHRVVLFLTSDEEIGSGTSRAAIEAEAARSVAVLVLEPSLPGGGAKTARKGVGEYLVRVTGRAAHAGIEPQKGINAIVELAHQVLRLQGLQAPDRGLTVNAGVIRGGTRANVVPAEAELDVDVRVASLADVELVARAFASLTPHLPGAQVHVEGGINRPPLERTPAVVALYQLARSVAGELGHDLTEGSTGGGSDGNFTAALGVPTLDGLGPIGGGAHALDEHVELEPLSWRAALIAGLLLRIP